MFFRTIGLVFLIIVFIRFPGKKLIAEIIRSGYCDAFLKKIRRFEKCIFKLRKCRLHLTFLLDCKKNGVFPNFLRFELVNRHFKYSQVYRKYQIRLLKEEIKSKRINILENDTQRVKEELQRTFSVLDFCYICSLFLLANDKSILHHDNIHKQKLQNLLKISLSNNFSDRIIFNFSSYKLTGEEKKRFV